MAGTVCSSLRAELMAMRQAAMPNRHPQCARCHPATRGRAGRREGLGGAPVPGITAVPARHDGLARREFIILSQLRTGYSPLNSETVFRVRFAGDDRSPACGEQDGMYQAPHYEVTSLRLGPSSAMGA